MKVAALRGSRHFGEARYAEELRCQMLKDAENGEHNRARAADDILGIIKEISPQLRPSEQKVGAVILEDVYFAAYSTGAELARRAGVSEPTVTRFSRAAGSPNLRDLKLRLAQNLVIARTYVSPPPREEDGNSTQLWSGIFDDIQAAVATASTQLKQQDVALAASQIDRCTKLLAIGVGGGSSLAAQEVVNRFFRLGKSVQSQSDPQLMRMNATMLDRSDMLIAISTSGRSRDVIDAVGIAKDRGAFVLALTRPGTPLANAATSTLAIHVPESQNALKPTASRFAFLAAIDALALYTAFCQPKESQDAMRRMKLVLSSRSDGQPDGPLGD